METMSLSMKKAWVVAADMGYGHQRAAWPLRSIAEQGKVISANSYPGMPRSDFLLWKKVRSLYEAVSRFQRFPVLGDFVFNVFDSLQKIEKSAPVRGGSTQSSFQLRQTYGLIQRYSWGRHLIEKISKKPLPLITSFAPVALMAEYWKYPGPIILIVTDSDISRSWAPLDAASTRILYCVPAERAKARLRSYGVPASNIQLTGFPLEFHEQRAKEALARRLFLLDPSRRYQKTRSALFTKKFSKKRPIVISFAIGGAGAQDDIARALIQRLKPLFKNETVRLQIIVGIHRELSRTFPKARGVSLKAFSSKEAYFRSFPRLMEETDILWTKPSELVFFAALGIPLILSPPIGSQEVQNRKWLLDIGAGVDQLDPKFCHQWLPDFINSSRLAEAAMKGFVNMEKNGTKNIIEFIQDRFLANEK